MKAEKFDNSFKLNETQLEKLKQIIPEVFKDGFVDIGAMSDDLSDYSGYDVDEYSPKNSQAETNRRNVLFGF